MSIDLTTVYYDGEMSGLHCLFDYRNGKPGTAELIEFAAIAVNSQGKEIDSIEIKLDFNWDKNNPEMIEALKMNCFKAFMVENDYNTLSINLWRKHCLSRREAYYQIDKFLKKHATIQWNWPSGDRAPNKTLGAGQNIESFDRKFIQALYEEFAPDNGKKVYLPLDFYQIDTYEQAKAWYWKSKQIGQKTPKNLQLATLAEFFGFSTEGAHGALADVRMNILTHKAVEQSMGRLVMG